MKTNEEVREDFNQRGESISEWSKREGFDKRNVYAVISGRNKGNRGESHKIAIRLGLKKDITNEEDWMNKYK